ncbi:MAG: 16S rRNA (cytosine(967)-C(5))-methyltransferase RsmB [Myxococcaceae bacterium]|nr:16S rRNA (cytosine(967)-C(5))-methyltransferase RsmB [Myxococcaceae bacterium]
MNARALAIQILARVRATDAYLNLVLDAQLDATALDDPRDAGLVTELCYGATRRQMSLDFALAQFSNQPLEKLEDRVLAALRIGAYQHFYMRVPARAAVSETVEALKSLKLYRATGFVNAVLRKIATLERPPLPPEADEVKHLAIRESHPEWLVHRWIRQFGRERTIAMLEADNAAAPLVIRANSAKVGRDELLAQLREAGVAAEPTKLSPVGIVVPPVGRVEDLYGYAEGLWQVQDEAAQLVGLYAAVPEGARVLDACAAPGGKACHFAERNEVLAVDLHAHKLRKIESEARRLGVESRLQAKAHDATKPFPESIGEFHVVVVDAPCTGLGTLRRHPELRYRRRPEDLGRLAALQRSILEACQEQVPPGGLLVYAVCSVDFQEGPDQIEMFLRSHPEFTSEPPPGLAPEIPTWQGYLRTLPGPEGLDGFFCARLRRLY